jgi:hypothetical protein
VPIVRSTGITFFTAALSPPTMIASVPSFALKRAPDTGASTIAMPFFFRARPRARVPAGSAELMSITTAPRLRPGRASRTASRTSLPSGTMVISASEPSAASRAERQFPVPLRS